MAFLFSVHYGSASSCLAHKPTAAVFTTNCEPAALTTVHKRDAWTISVCHSVVAPCPAPRTEFPRAGFLGVGQGACYWHGVGGFWRSIIIIIIIPTFCPRPLCGPAARARAARFPRAMPHAISRCLVLIWQLAWVADKWVSILACLAFALWWSGWGAF